MIHFAALIAGLWCFFFLIQVVWTFFEAVKIWKIAKRIRPIKKTFKEQVLDFVNLYSILWYLLPVVLLGEKTKKP